MSCAASRLNVTILEERYACVQNGINTLVDIIVYCNTEYSFTQFGICVHSNPLQFPP